MEYFYGQYITTCIYLGYDRSGLLKIGMTDNWERRLKQIRNMNPEFSFLCVIKHDKPAVAEAMLHTKYSNKRVIGEWFELSVEDVKEILDMFLPDPPSIEDIMPMYKTATEGR